VRRRGLHTLALSAGLAFLAPATALAQGAWLPGKGEAIVGFQYQYTKTDAHLFSSPIFFGVDFGSKSIDFGTTQSQVASLDAEIGVTDRFALTGTIAFIGSRYTEGGTQALGPFNAESALDDGTWHSSFQDGRIGARYRALDDGAWALAPFISYGIPTTDYGTIGHSAVGRGLTELQLGVHWGRILSSSGKPFGYLQGTVSHAFMEDVRDISLSRTSALLGFGYFLDSVTLNVWTLYQNMHGGIDWARDLDAHDEHLGEALHDHDQAAAADFWRAGLGASVPVSLSFEVYATVSTTLWGINTHDATALVVGVTWNFQAFGGTDWWYE